MMVDMEQMIITLDAVKKTKMPIWVGLTCSIDDKGGIYLGENVEAAIDNGESLEKAVMYLNEIDIDAICIMHTRIKDTLNCLKELKKIWDGLIGVYPNSSSYNNSKNLESTEWAFKQVMQKEKFIDYAKTWTDSGVDFIGGCCGVNVDHIKELKKIIK